MNCEDCYGRGWRWQGVTSDNADRMTCDTCAGTGTWHREGGAIVWLVMLTLGWSVLGVLGMWWLTW